jgi:hypothetical protein
MTTKLARRAAKKENRQLRRDHRLFELARFAELNQIRKRVDQENGRDRR